MPTTAAPEVATDFRTLLGELRAAGLLDRRLGDYTVRIGLTLAAFGALWWALFAIGASWATLGVAALLGFVYTQLGFVSHDAGHNQVFRSRRANRLLGLGVGNALLGLSFGWWVPKHNAHHAHPNETGRDPDIGVGVLGPAPDEDENAGENRSLAGWFGRHGAELFFPLMLLRSTGLYVSGAQDLLRRRDRAALVESVPLVVQVALYMTAIFWVLPPLMAVAFIAVHQAVFSVYLGCSFAPNHKGMRLVDGEDEREMSFAWRQVVTARNIKGGKVVSFVWGGLNYQIEHHLVPGMPRPNLARARPLVRAFCVENGYGYCEEGVVGSFRSIVGSLREPVDTSPPLLEPTA